MCFSKWKSCASCGSERELPELPVVLLEVEELCVWKWKSGALLLLEVEEWCFWHWKSCAFRSGRVVLVAASCGRERELPVVLFEVEERVLCFSKLKCCAFRSGRVVLFEVEELCFSKLKGCAFRSAK